MSGSDAAVDAEALAARYRAVRDEIVAAARAADRDPAELTTIVVTKFHPPELVRRLIELGHREFGESRQQELGPKAEALAALAPSWHFVGQLQSKKAGRVLEHARTVHSLDRSSLLRSLAGADRAVDVFVQVNLTPDLARGGVAPESLAAFVEEVLGAPRLRLRGLMAVAGRDADPRAEFARVRRLRDEVVLPLDPAADALSMGMSGDYPAAIAEGATHLRIGTAITGNRPAGAYARN